MTTTPKSPLKKARLKAGYKTQAEFALAIGMSESQMSNLERGAVESFPRSNTIKKMAKALNVPEKQIYLWFFKQ